MRMKKAGLKKAISVLMAVAMLCSFAVPFAFAARPAAAAEQTGITTQNDLTDDNYLSLKAGASEIPMIKDADVVIMLDTSDDMYFPIHAGKDLASLNKDIVYKAVRKPMTVEFFRAFLQSFGINIGRLPVTNWLIERFTEKFFPDVRLAVRYDKDSQSWQCRNWELYKLGKHCGRGCWTDLPSWQRSGYDFLISRLELEKGLARDLAGQLSENSGNRVCVVKFQAAKEYTVDFFQSKQVTKGFVSLDSAENIASVQTAISERVRDIYCECPCDSTIMTAAKEVIEGSAREDANKYIIMVTNGRPTYLKTLCNTFIDPVGKHAISDANELKAGGTVIFGVNLFGSAAETPSPAVTDYMTRLCSENCFKAITADKNLDFVYVASLTPVPCASQAAKDASKIVYTLDKDVDFADNAVAKVLLDGEPYDGVTVSIEGKTLTAVGFDFAANLNKTLEILVPLKAAEGAVGELNVCNKAASGIYDASGKRLEPFPGGLSLFVASPEAFVEIADDTALAALPGAGAASADPIVKTGEGAGTAAAVIALCVSGGLLALSIRRKQG